MTSMKTVAAAGLLFVAAPAWAGQSMVAGQRLQYNHAYPCKGERVIVAHCRDEDDSSYCQMVYPDRPFVNGNQVAPIEMRGDIVAKLNACSQVASAPAPASQTANAAKGNVAVSPPGLDKDASWWVMDYSKNLAVFFLKEGIKRSAGSGQSWFTAVYSKTQDVSDTIKGVQYFQFLFTADCAKGTFVVPQQAFLDEDAQLIHAGNLNQPPAKPEAGSFADEQLNIVCGKPQKLRESVPLEGDGNVLVYYYMSELRGNRD